MAILQLSSSNPEFSKIIRKHPQGGMRAASLKMGTAFGWYSRKHSCYNIYFRDAENEVSFSEFEGQTFEYLNVSRYNSPLFCNHALKEFFGSALKNPEIFDTAGYKNSCFVNLIRIKRSNLIEKIKAHFSDFNIEVIAYEGTPKDFSLRIETQKSLYELLHFIDLFCLFIATTNREYFYRDQSMLEKYLSSLAIIDAPYFFRYVFKLHLLWKNKEFHLFKSMLENSKRYTIKMSLGNNIQARKRFVDKYLDLEKTIFDVGCGEGYYTLNYAQKTTQVIHAVDIDPEVLEILKYKAKRKDINNIMLYPKAEKLPPNLFPQIILTEVIEHMSVKKAEKFLHMLADKHPEKIILTTPNKDFNQYYFDDEEELRHDDHDFEMAKNEFKKWVLALCKKIQKKDEQIATIQAEFEDVGDVVDDNPTTLGCVLYFEYI